MAAPTTQSQAHRTSTAEAGSRKINESAPSSLKRGLFFGSLAPRFYAFSASYNCWKGTKELNTLVIDPKSVRLDIQGFYDWTAKFVAPPPETYSYSRGSKGERDGATATTIRKKLDERPTGVPVFIYVGLHTERSGANGKDRFFLPANRPSDLSGPDTQRMISYVEFSKLLSASSNPSSVALLTESCYSDNIMGLPFKYFVEPVGEELQMRQEETGFSGKAEWESKPLMLQFAATTPDNLAAYYSTGAAYTQAFFKESVSETLGFEDMMINIQKSMDATFKLNVPKDGHQLSQQHVVYSSRVIQKDEDVWSALGFELKLHGT